MTMKVGHRRVGAWRTGVAAATALAGTLVGSGVGATTPPDDTTETTTEETSGGTATPTAGADPCDVSSPSDPMSSAPGSSEPASSAPGSSAPGSSAPASSEPASSAPGSSAPGSSESMSSAPGSTDPTGTDGAATSPAPSPVALTLTDTGIDGLPDDLAAGVADVTITDETAASGGEVNFTLVEAGTEPTAFADGLTSLFEGGPFPDFFLNTSGTTGGMITLAEGEYIVWIDLAANEDRPSTADDIVTAPLTVGPGDPMPVIPGTNDHVRGGDYLFDADIVPCDSTVTFTNSSDNQFHHVIVVDFGTNDPVVVEQQLPVLFAGAEDGPPPPGIDMSQVNFEFASSGVFGPDASGTFEADFQPGHTYVAVCFIQDREGGAPHAIQHDMYDVFTVEG